MMRFGNDGVFFGQIFLVGDFCLAGSDVFLWRLIQHFKNLELAK